MKLVSGEKSFTMKFKLLFALVFAALFVIHCSKEKTTLQDSSGSVEGELTGFDFTECYCCWGWLFQPENGEAVLIGSWPDEFPIEPTMNGSFPVKVRAKFTSDANCFENNRKVIATQLELQ